MIEVSNLKKIFRTEEVETWALSDVDNPTEGSYKLQDREVATLNEDQRTDLRKGTIGFVFQSFNLIDGSIVKELPQ